MPGDKSIAHRYALLAALADGRSPLHQFCARRRLPVDPDCLRRLGVDDRRKGRPAPSLYWDEVSGNSVRRRGPLDAGNSGTTMRLLAGVLAGHPFSSTLVGDASLSRRPMRRVIEPLERMGARIEADRRPPAADGSRRAPARDCLSIPTRRAPR